MSLKLIPDVISLMTLFNVSAMLSILITQIASGADVNAEFP
jgi:hypothetical protein